ncbi:MAG: hypothetical protein KBS83_02035 [Lachnospiraceae bacterium]|nr:hypothetical protein [Candidatus Equihabitans merdae]
MSLFKKVAAVGVAAVMGLGLLAGCGQGIPGSKAVSTVNGEAISLGSLAFYTRYQQAEMSQWMTMMGSGSGMYDQEFDAESGMTYGDEMRNTALTELEDYTLVRQHAEEMGVALTDEDKAEIEQVADAYVTKNGDDVLKSVGASKADVINVLNLLKTQSLMLEPIAADVDTEVSEEEAAQTSVTLVTLRYNGTNGVTKEEAEAAAEEILDKLKAEKNPATADMEAIADSVMENAATSVFHFSTNDNSDSTLNAAVMEAIDGLGEGEIADKVIQGEDNECLYIVRVDSFNDPEATASKMESIANERKAANLEETVAAWREESTITRDEKVLAKLKVTDESSYVFAVEEPTESTAE